MGLCQWGGHAARGLHAGRARREQRGEAPSRLSPGREPARTRAAQRRARREDARGVRFAQSGRGARGAAVQRPRIPAAQRVFAAGVAPLGHLPHAGRCPPRADVCSDGRPSVSCHPKARGDRDARGGQRDQMARRPRPAAAQFLQARLTGHHLRGGHVLHVHVSYAADGARLHERRPLEQRPVGATYADRHRLGLSPRRRHLDALSVCRGRRVSVSSVYNAQGEGKGIPKTERAVPQTDQRQSGAERLGS
mmetsp:Transcript_859/g.1880  ORF Transcript_859/g.1880 Transcript_859/m.1880 type:complete len:250 (-) Transcript_859:204-953(-)